MEQQMSAQKKPASETLSPAGTQGAEKTRQPAREEWRDEFPYPWSEDEVVTRRDTLRFLLAGSGALFLATGVLTIVGNLPAGAQGILINLPGKGLVAYSDVCTHLSCAVTYQEANKKLHCPCHEGFFDAATGNVLAGPPTRPLPLIELAVQDGIIYAVKVVPR